MSSSRSIAYMSGIIDTFFKKRGVGGEISFSEMMFTQGLSYFVHMQTSATCLLFLPL